MDIADASVFFDDDPVYDGYTGYFLFSGQSASFDDSTSDGATLRRRVLSVGPDIVAPPRRVVQIYNDKWLVGVNTTDGFYGEPVRQHFPMKRATDLAQVLTPLQALQSANGVSAYVHKHYFKETSNPLTNSEIDTFWNIFIPPSEPVVRGTIFKIGTDYFRIRNDYLPVEGLYVAQSDQLEPGSLVSVQYEAGTMNTVTEVITSNVITLVALRLETSKFYRYRSAGDVTIVKGDEVVFLPPNAALRQNGTFVMAGVKWRIVNMQPEIDAVAALIRRV